MSHMSSLSRRLTLDLALTIVIVIEMLYSLTGNVLHEAIGLALFVGIAVHLILSKKWIGNTVRTAFSSSKRLAGKRAVLAFVAALLLIDMVLLIVSSVIISLTLRKWGIISEALGTSALWSTIHTASAYGLCVLTAIHLAMHWSLFAKSLHVEYDPGRRQAIENTVSVAAGLLVLAVGGTGIMKTADKLRLDTLSDGNGQQVDSFNDARQLLRRSKKELRAQYEQDPRSLDLSICPLCHKECPLSAPECNRPYEEGLI